MQFDAMSPSLELMTVGLIRGQFITYLVTSLINDLAMCNFYNLRIIAYAEVCSMFHNFFVILSHFRNNGKLLKQFVYKLNNILI